jgi:hypothetical protein
VISLLGLSPVARNAFSTAATATYISSYASLPISPRTLWDYPCPSHAVFFRSLCRTSLRSSYDRLFSHARHVHEPDFPRFRPHFLKPAAGRTEKPHCTAGFDLCPCSLSSGHSESRTAGCLGAQIREASGRERGPLPSTSSRVSARPGAVQTSGRTQL